MDRLCSKHKGSHLLITAVLILSFSAIQWQKVLAADSHVIDETETPLIEISRRITEQMDSFNRQIASLESEFGPFDLSLLEPLKSLTELLVDLGDFDEASSLLNRRLQLVRVIEGPQSLSQIPALTELIENAIRRQQWQDVTDAFENIYWLQSQQQLADPSIVIEALNTLQTWRFALIYLDDPNKRARHFKDAVQIQRRLLTFAEEEFGTESIELIPWLYQEAVEEFRARAFFDSKDELGDQARYTLVRLESRRHGLNNVKRIRRLTESTGNLEAEAMAMIYEADFQMLLKIGTASKLYKDAMDRLKQAGIEQKSIEAFFARPVVLPEAKFYFSLDEALAAQVAYGYSVESNGDASNDIIHLGDFIAWNESLPSVRRPEIPQAAATISRELHMVDMGFTINSLGKGRAPKAQQSEPDKTRVRRDAIDAIKEMQFRPRYINGKRIRIRNVTMRYLYPPAL